MKIGSGSLLQALRKIRTLLPRSEECFHMADNIFMPEEDVGT
jgi:hypothetical protein